MKKNRRENSHTKSLKFSQAHAARALNRRYTDASEELLRGSKQLKKLSKTFKNAKKEQLAGRMAEVFHEATFNANAKLKGKSDLRAITTYSKGNVTAKADILIQSSGRTVSKAQIKYHKTALRSAASIKDGYKGYQKVIPVDQLSSAKSVLKRQAQKNLQRGQIRKSKSRLEALKTVSGKIKAKGVSSDSLSLADAINLAQNPTKLSKKSMAVEITGASKNGFLSGALGTGIMSAAQNTYNVTKGKQTAKAALKETAKATVKSGIECAATTVLEVGIKRAALKAGFKGVAKSSLPLTIATIGLDVSKDIYSATKGDIGSEELSKRIGSKAAKSGASWAMAEGCAALGTLICPGPGTIIGGMVGGAIGYFAAEQTLKLF